MINDFNNGTVGWTDWNIVLDENGGPNHVGNFCFSPLYGDIIRGRINLSSLLLFHWSFLKIYSKKELKGLTVLQVGVI